MAKKKLTKTIWYGSEVDEKGNPIIPSSESINPLERLNEGELYLHLSDKEASLWTLGKDGKPVQVSGDSSLDVDISDYLLKSIWESSFEIKLDNNGNQYLFGKLPIALQYGLTMYADSGLINIPSIAQGLPYDYRTIWYNPSTNKIEVIGGTGGGVSNFWDLSGIPSWITNSKPKYTYSEIEGTPDLNGYATQSWVNTRIASLINGAPAAYDTLKEIADVLQGNVNSIGDIITALGTKWTQDNTKIANWDTAYSWGNHANAGYALKSYVDDTFVTLGSKQTITGEKNFTGGLKVNGSPIYYDSTKKYWKLEGDLLVTGGVTMYGSDSEFTPSTIMDAIQTDGVTIRVNRTTKNLEVIGNTSGATTLGGLSNVGNWADSVADVDRIMYQAAGSSNWVSKNLSDLELKGDYLPNSGGELSGSLSILNSNDVWYPLMLVRNSSSPSASSGIAFANSNGYFANLEFKQNVNGFYRGNVATGKRYLVWDEYTLTKLSQLTDDVVSGNYLPISTYTASDILSKLLTVDGSGSGLDADTLDGYHANVGAKANTVALRDESGALSAYGFKSKHYQKTINAVGWYRIYTGDNSSKGVNQVFLQIGRNYSNSSGESYSYSISVASQKVSVTRLSGTYNTHLITKIRIAKDTSQGVWYIDYYRTSATSNLDCISGVGSGTFQTPTLVEEVPLYSCEFDTGYGCKSETYQISDTGNTYQVGFIGNLNGNALSATKLETPRTIWGQSFDGSANVSGLLSNISGLKINKTGTGFGWIDFHYAASQSFTSNIHEIKSGFLAINDTLIVKRLGNVGIGTENPACKLDVNGMLLASTKVESSDWVSDTAQIRANATGTKYYIGVAATTAGQAVIQGGNSGTGSIPLLLNPNNGNVLIGTTTDSGYKLDVNGTFRNINGKIEIRNDTSSFKILHTSLGGLLIYPGISDTELCRIDYEAPYGTWFKNGIRIFNTGYIALGNVVASYPLHVVGDIYSSANLRAGSKLYVNSHAYLKGHLFLDYDNEGIYVTRNGIAWHDSSNSYATALLQFASDGAVNVPNKLKVSNIPIYKSQDDVLYIDGNLVVRGGITMYGTNTTSVPSLLDSLPIASTTTKGIASFDSNFFSVGSDGKVTFIGSNNGGVADSVAWANVTGKPTTLSGYGITDAKISNGVITLGGSTITPLTSHQTIYNLTFQAGSFSAVTFDPNGAAKTVNIPTTTSHISEGDNLYFTDTRAQAAITGGASTIKTSNLTKSRALISNSSGKVAVSAVTSTELGYLDGVTSAIQTQLNGKLSLTGGTINGSGDYLYVPLFINALNDSISGITFKTNGTEKGHVGYSSGLGIRLHSSTTAGIAVSDSNVPIFYTGDGSVKNTLWHSGNDGSGSGLDADLLDGVQESGFCRHLDGIPITSHRGIGYGFVEQGWILNGPALSIGYSGDNYLMQLQSPADYTALHFRNRMNGSWGSWKEIAFTDSNVASATKLQTARTIWGQSFDGTGDIGGDIKFSIDAANIFSEGGTQLATFSNSYLVLGYGNCPKGLITYLDGYNIVFRSGYSWNTSMLIDGYGNVGIGFVQPSHRLEVNGNGYFVTNLTIGETYIASGAIGFNRNTEVGGRFNNSYNGWQFHVDRSDNRLWIYTEGTNSGLKAYWDTSGNYLVYGGITMYGSSDKRLKRNIRTFSASEELMRLGGVYQFEYIDEEIERNNTYKGTHIGMIYQNVKGTILDKMCYEREDGYGALNYLDSSFISLIAAVGIEHETRIQKLERENKELRQEIERLRVS